MNEFLPVLLRLAVGCAAGLVVGAIFFGGLWLTTRQLLTSPNPGLLALASFIGRMSVLGLGMFLVAQAGAAALIAAACGILAVRQWMIHHARVESAGVSS